MMLMVGVIGLGIAVAGALSFWLGVGHGRWLESSDRLLKALAPFRGGEWLAPVRPEFPVRVGVSAKTETVVVSLPFGQEATLTAEEADQLSAQLYIAYLRAIDHPMQAGVK